MRLSWLFPTLFLGLFLAIGLGMLGYGLWMVKRSGEAAYWPITPGTLSECKFEESSDSRLHLAGVRLWVHLVVVHR